MIGLGSEKMNNYWKNDRRIYVQRFKNCTTVGLCYQDTFMTSLTLYQGLASCSAWTEVLCSFFHISPQLYNRQQIIDLDYFFSIASPKHSLLIPLKISLVKSKTFSYYESIVMITHSWTRQAFSEVIHPNLT